MKITTLVTLLVPASLTVGAQSPTPVLNLLREQVGKAIFHDTDLSEPRGQACASCHVPKFGFKGNGDPSAAVIAGAVAGRFSARNPPSAAYAFQSPSPGYQNIDGEQTYVGGQFWDGRASSLAEQAKAPFLNPVEMNNSDKASVVKKVCQASYGLLFKLLNGFQMCTDPSNIAKAYDAIADSIAAYERSSEVNSFSSRYDKYLAGKLHLTAKELKGMQLFEGKAGCAGCHPSGKNSPFTDFTYDNLGIPKNTSHPATKFAPTDFGLGARVGSQEDGRFKVSTLRNIAISPPYGHNGYFRTLKDIVHFYNTRDVPKEKWPSPEVKANVNAEELGNLGLTDDEENALIAFLEALTDEGRGPGY